MLSEVKRGKSFTRRRTPTESAYTRFERFETNRKINAERLRSIGKVDFLQQTEDKHDRTRARRGRYNRNVNVTKLL